MGYKLVVPPNALVLKGFALIAKNRGVHQDYLKRGGALFRIEASYPFYVLLTFGSHASFLAALICINCLAGFIV